MFKLVVLLSALCAVASAGYLGGGYAGLGGYGGHGYGLGYSAIAAPAYHSGISYHAPAVVAAAPIVKSYAVAAPVVKTYAAPLATSYANTYKVATKSVPVVHAAPAYAVHAAPAVIAAPAYHSAASYHGGLGHVGSLGYAGYGHGYGGYGHSLYH